VAGAQPFPASLVVPTEGVAPHASPMIHHRGINERKAQPPPAAQTPLPPQGATPRTSLRETRAESSGFLVRMRSTGKLIPDGAVSPSRNSLGHAVKSQCHGSPPVHRRSVGRGFLASDSSLGCLPVRQRSPGSPDVARMISAPVGGFGGSLHLNSQPPQVWTAAHSAQLVASPVLGNRNCQDVLGSRDGMYISCTPSACTPHVPPTVDIQIQTALDEQGSMILEPARDSSCPPPPVRKAPPSAAPKRAAPVIVEPPPPRLAQASSTASLPQIFASDQRGSPTCPPPPPPCPSSATLTALFSALSAVAEGAEATAARLAALAPQDLGTRPLLSSKLSSQSIHSGGSREGMTAATRELSASDLTAPVVRSLPMDGRRAASIHLPIPREAKEAAAQRQQEQRAKEAPVVRYRCQTCGKVLPTREEAVRHCENGPPKWSEDESKTFRFESSGTGRTASTGSTRSSEGASVEAASANTATPLPPVSEPEPVQAPELEPDALREPAAPLRACRSVSPTAAALLAPRTAAVARSTSPAPAVPSAPRAPAAPRSTSPEPAAPSGQPVPAAAARAASAPPQTEPTADVAYTPVTSNGQPAIVRQVDPESGKARTVVLMEDGKQSVFGDHTVASVTNCAESEMSEWLDSLSDIQLRGLVHELGQRLLENSRIYQGRLSELESLSGQANYAFFGLPHGATEKELDLAYRKMAKKMHPDKNGGTEVAKERFQHMKERYEALKSRYSPADKTQTPQAEKQAEEQPSKGKKATEEGEDVSAGKGEDEQANKEESEAGQNPGSESLAMQERRKEAYDEDEREAYDEDVSPSTNRPPKTIAYNPNDRTSLDTTAMDMVRQLKTLLNSLAVINQELQRIRPS